MQPSPNLPQSPEELLEQLFTIFPQYRADYPAPVPGHDYPITFHSVLIAFSQHFKAEAASEDQLKALGNLVNVSVDAGGDLENAFGTCFLEHLHQIRATRALRPHLSKAALQRTKA